MEKLVLSPDFPGMEDFFRSLPARFALGEGEVLHHGRNEVRRMAYQGVDYVVKSFCRPNLFNRLVYGTLRGSKACRSYRHALAFLSIGVSTPTPVGYLDLRRGLLLDRSYYVSRLSPCPYTYADLYSDERRTSPVQADGVSTSVAIGESVGWRSAVLLEIGRVTALIHENGYLHRDYSRGNILFGPTPDGGVRIEIVDLNRMFAHRHIGLRQGCKNFERLPATPAMRRLLAQGYAQARGFDPDQCERLIAHFRKRQPERIAEVDVFQFP